MKTKQDFYNSLFCETTKHEIYCKSYFLNIPRQILKEDFGNINVYVQVSNAAPTAQNI